MEIQSLSICCPSKGGCINRCRTCTARQHENPYEPKYLGSKEESLEYWADVRKRMEEVRKIGCSTLMLTGSNEPQQNWRWLETLGIVNRSLPNPFNNIEIQTTGAKIDLDYLKALKGIGLTTLALSTFNVFHDDINRDIEESCDKKLSIENICNMAHYLGLNIRICVNITDYMFKAERYIPDDKYQEWAQSWVKEQHEFYRPTSPIPKRYLSVMEQAIDVASHDTHYDAYSYLVLHEIPDLLKRCSELHANQVTFRKMWSNPNLTCPETEWIANNTKYSDAVIQAINRVVTGPGGGQLIMKLPYGAARYDYMGFSIVVDTDSMGKDPENVNIKYNIIRENGKMYSSWDSPATVVF